MKVTIDPNSGLCFGVIYAIKAAEEELNKTGKLYCLGDIVHNNKEVERLKAKGLVIINHEEYKNLLNSKVLIRAHGEPPETYKIAIENNIELIDASCPVVLKLQNRIRLGNEEMMEDEGQTVIYGKEGHAEVLGLVGQTLQKAIIINNEKDLDKIDYSKPIRLYSQTTQSIKSYEKMINEIQARILKTNPQRESDFIANETICSQVSNRSPQLQTFSAQHEVIVFVSGKKSSNGIYLYGICKAANPNSYFVSDSSELQKEWFDNIQTVGVCGATSTPMWVMEEIANLVSKMK
jgi:4-hydroxy-3-methylbut-2-en-1-yl diphosphate reductase